MGVSKYMIDIDDNVVIEQINNILNTIFNDQMARKYSASGDVIASAVKELVYSHKDEIVEKVVDRATKEIVRKGLPKMLERVGEQI